MSTPRSDLAAVIAFSDAAEFETWLADHVDEKRRVWLKIAKIGSGVASPTSDEAVDVGLCYGWISGQRKAYDEGYYLQKYVPRRPGSRWSQVNVRKVEALIAAGRMRPAGLAEVEAAKADGRWDAAYEISAECDRPTRSRGGTGREPSGGRDLRFARQERPIRRDPGCRHRPHRREPGCPPPQGRNRAGSTRCRGARERCVTRLKAVVFDLDGTLLDSMAAAPAAYVEAISSLGGPRLTAAEIVATWHIGPAPAAHRHRFGRISSPVCHVAGPQGRSLDRRPRSRVRRRPSSGGCRPLLVRVRSRRRARRPGLQCSARPCGGTSPT